MYKQTIFKWRAETGRSSNIRAATEVRLNLRRPAAGADGKDPHQSPSLPPSNAQYNVTIMSHINTTIQHCI